MRINIEFQHQSCRIEPARLRRSVCQVLQEEQCRGYDLTVVLTDSSYIRTLNRRFRRKDQVTDVISFTMLDGTAPSFGSAALGDIYICLPRARQQARLYRTTLERELRRLAIHGTLHLLGYDHIKPRETRLMRSKEEHYLEL